MTPIQKKALQTIGKEIDSIDTIEIYNKLRSLIFESGIDNDTAIPILSEVSKFVDKINKHRNEAYQWTVIVIQDIEANESNSDE